MAFFVFLFGLVWGSFLNVLIDRLPNGENVFWGRSHCDYCKKPLRWFELIPVISFIMQGGRCLRCKRKLSWQYPVVELITGLGFFSFWYATSYYVPITFSAWIIFSSFLVMFVTDIKYQIIPDSMVIASLLSSLAWVWFGLPHGEFLSHILSAMGSCLLFFALWLITKKRGMGLGDVKLSFVLGILLGYPQIVMALYVAFLTGALAGVILILRGAKTLKSKIAFGPFLIIGTTAIILFQSVSLHIWNTIF